MRVEKVWDDMESELEDRGSTSDHDGDNGDALPAIQ